MGRKGKEDQSSREGQCQYQKGKWSQKGTQKGFVFCRREIRLVCSIIRGQENGSITNYFPLLPDLQAIWQLQMLSQRARLLAFYAGLVYNLRKHKITTEKTQHVQKAQQ